MFNLPLTGSRARVQSQGMSKDLPKAPKTPAQIAALEKLARNAENARRRREYAKTKPTGPGRGHPVIPKTQEQKDAQAIAAGIARDAGNAKRALERQKPRSPRVRLKLPGHEKFVVAVTSGVKAPDAYMQHVAHDCLRASASAGAFRLLSRPDVKARLRYLQEVAEASTQTIEEPVTPKIKAGEIITKEEIAKHLTALVRTSSNDMALVSASREAIKLLHLDTVEKDTGRPPPDVILTYLLGYAGRVGPDMVDQIGFEGLARRITDVLSLDPGTLGAALTRLADSLHPDPPPGEPETVAIVLHESNSGHVTPSITDNPLTPEVMSEAAVCSNVLHNRHLHTPTT